MKYIYFVLFSFLFSSCHPGEISIPKPTGYPRIEFPANRSYRLWHNPDCPFSIRYPNYAVVQKDSGENNEKCWMNVFYKDFNARIHLSYKSIYDQKSFDEMTEDARTFAYKHSVKAEDISDSTFHLPGKIHGILYSISGNAASSIQFYATDSSKHYLRGSLYFYSRPNKDSLQPVINFIRTDIDTLIRSIKWE